MPAIQAMRSDALASRAKEDVQEKVPSFFNQVNKALGQNIVQGQDSAQSLSEARFSAANQLAATLRQKLDGEGGLAELVAGAGLDMVNSAIAIVLGLLGKTDLGSTEIFSNLLTFSSEIDTLRLQWDAAAATFAQWTVQAGNTNIAAGTFTPGGGASEAVRALGGRGAIMYRDALTPRWTDRDYYTGSSLNNTNAATNTPASNLYQTYFAGSSVVGKGNNYDTYYSWGSVGSISRTGRY